MTDKIDWIKGAAYWCKPIPDVQPWGFFINADFTKVHDGTEWSDAKPAIKNLMPSGMFHHYVIKQPESPAIDWNGAKLIGRGYDTTDWQNSKIERLSDTCIDDMGIANFQEQTRNDPVLNAIRRRQESAQDDQAIPPSFLEGRKSITDVARSIEAALIEEHACMPFPDGDPRYFETSDVVGKRAQEMADKLEAAQKDVHARCSSYRVAAYPHYFKDVTGVDAIDLYHVARLYDIADPALFHAFKKIACAGKRGAKDQAQDVQEAIDALKRWQELNV
jgi:hypothetical protein